MTDVVDTTAIETKKRRFTSRDFDKVAEFVKTTFEARKNDARRTKFERIWTEVDRQIQLEALEAVDEDPDPDDDWHAAIELGLLSRSSEVLSADVTRLIFPNNREWQTPHVDMRKGSEAVDQEKQENEDKRLRAFMSQQHIDFGFIQAVKTSLKEIIHHGGMGAEVEAKRLTLVHKGKGIQTATAPVWRPHSMWNTFPDPSMGITNNGLFYEGSMIFRTWMRKSDVLASKKFVNKDKIAKKDGNEKGDLEVLKYYGPLFIERQRGGDIFLPNMKVILVEDIFAFGEAVDTPFSPVIYTGWEKFDVRNPYFLSPIMKMSPIQTFTTIATNNFLDWAALTVEPPILYNATSPEMARDGGPKIKPGKRTGITGSADFQEVRIGDGSPILQAMEMGFQQINEGTTVDETRTGVAASTEQTATEIQRKAVASELRVADFARDFEQQGLAPFLYMQHEMNKSILDKKGYLFYNDRPGAPDFEVMTKKELPDNVIFEITGSRGVLGEIQRGAAVMEVTRFIKDLPNMAGITRDDQIAIMLYGDAGVKNPEKLLRINDSDANPSPEIVQLTLERDQAIEAAEEVQAKFQEELGEVQTQLVDANQKNAELEIKIEQKNSVIERERVNTTIERRERKAVEDELRLVKNVSMSKAEMFKIVETIRREKAEATDEGGEPESFDESLEKLIKIKNAMKDEDGGGKSLNVSVGGTTKTIEINPTEQGGFAGKVTTEEAQQPET